MRAVNARWAISFADLCLLLLGFLIIAQAKPDPVKLAAGMPDTPSVEAAKPPTFIAGRLFEPGEAVLTSTGRSQIAALAAHAAANRIHLESIGADHATSRLDGWELAAARAAAVARALVASGIREDRIQLTIDRGESHPQRLSIVAAQ